MGSDHRAVTETFVHRNVVATPGQWKHLQDDVSSELVIGIAVARFNHAITTRLFSGAVDALLENGITSIKAVSVPGAVELPLAAQRLFEEGKVDGVVYLGCVIRGETGHYDFVCNIASEGCLSVALKYSAPVGFGVLTVDNADQAMARSGDVQAGERNAGYDASLAVLELLGIS